MTSCSPHSVEADGWGATAMVRGVGPFGEDIAVQHLRMRDRLTVLHRNWRPKSGQLRGEIDIVALDRAAAELVICEVKTRRDADRFGGAIAALGVGQQQRLRRLATQLLREEQFGVSTVRGDLIAVDLGRRPTLTHVIGIW